MVSQSGGICFHNLLNRSIRDSFSIVDLVDDDDLDEDFQAAVVKNVNTSIANAENVQASADLLTTLWSSEPLTFLDNHAQHLESVTGGRRGALDDLVSPTGSLHNAHIQLHRMATDQDFIHPSTLGHQFQHTDLCSYEVTENACKKCLDMDGVLWARADEVLFKALGL